MTKPFCLLFRSRLDPKQCNCAHVDGQMENCDGTCTAKYRVYTSFNFKKCLEDCALSYLKCKDICQTKTLKKWSDGHIRVSLEERPKVEINGLCQLELSDSTILQWTSPSRVFVSLILYGVSLGWVFCWISMWFYFRHEKGGEL